MPADDHSPGTAIDCRGVGLRRDDNWVLRHIDWRVAPGERWVVLGANGSGKTSLVRIAALYDHPSEGVLYVLGDRLGRVDVRLLRRRIAMVSAAMTDLLSPKVEAADVVMCAIKGALEPWWHQYTASERKRALDLLAELGIGHLARHRFITLSSGERQRVLLARALMNEPDLLFLDEPTAGLDLLGREEFVEDLARVAASGPATVLVTHHLEEIPPNFTHLLMLRDGEVAACGPIEDALTEDSLSEAMGLPLVLERHGGRWSARKR